MSSLVSRTSVVIPALNEEATVAGVVKAVLADAPLEVLVIDSDSTDSTAAEAALAGARVLNWRDIAPGIPPRAGKGEALWRGIGAAQGEFVAFVDADLTAPTPQMISRLVEPLSNPEIQLVKARYRRPLGGNPTGGGRVTELTAKPLLRRFFPDLSNIEQPLAGEYAIRRQSAIELPIDDGYAVEIGMLIDVANKFGVEAIAQVELDDRPHRNRPLHELTGMSDVILGAVLGRVEGTSVSNTHLDQRPPWASVL